MFFSGSPLPAAPQTSAQQCFPRRLQPATRPETPPAPAKTVHPPPPHIPPAPKPPEGFFIFVTVHLSHAPFMIYLYFSELFAKNQHQIMASSIIHPES